MTRETKIGLLVGLAFIIVIGILLSDHITGSMQPPQATLLTTDGAIRTFTSITTPGGAQLPPREIRPGPVQPDRVINIPERRQTNPPPVVEVGPREGDGHVVRPEQQPPTRNPLENIPDTERVDQRPPRGQEDHQDLPTGVRQYTAEPGDTLSKLAGRLMGKNTKANRDAIIKLNTSLQKDPDHIRSGDVYLIPSPAGSTAPIPVSMNNPTTRPVSGSELVYVTRPKDNLWKIALEQVGSTKAVQQIRELNKDVLTNGDFIKPDMKLRLPARQVASAN